MSMLLIASVTVIAIFLGARALDRRAGAVEKNVNFKPISRVRASVVVLVLIFLAVGEYFLVKSKMSASFAGIFVPILNVIIIGVVLQNSEWSSRKQK